MLHNHEVSNLYLTVTHLNLLLSRKCMLNSYEVSNLYVTVTHLNSFVKKVYVKQL